MPIQPIARVVPAVPAATQAAAPVSQNPAPATVAQQATTLAVRPDVQATAVAAPLTAASQASGILGLSGLTGVGKTRQMCEAIEYCWETYHKIALVSSSDLGGWGNKLLSLIELGIARVWYMRNHVDPFATVELASMGGFPAEILDPATGYADPHVEIVLPRQVRWVPLCPHGHPLGQFQNEPAMQTALKGAGRPCPTCQTPTTLINLLRTDRVIVRPALFDHVGMWAFDSMTQINDWGMADLQDQSAKGLLPHGEDKGSALGSADALESGPFRFGTSSKQQYGFLQQRTYGWLANVRGIPDQASPAVMTFGIELGKGDDESGGQAVMGPKIAGNARTSAVPGWLGNSLHLTKDPHNPPEMSADGEVVMHHRIWTATHISPTDPRHIPYLAKHRGEPGIPPFLEDASTAAPFSTCSIKVFLRLLDDQRQAVTAADRTRYKDAPGIVTGPMEADAETVVGTAPTLGSVPGAMPSITPVLAGGSVVPVAVAGSGRVVPVPVRPVPVAVVASAAPVAPVVESVPLATPPPATVPARTRTQRTPRPPTI